MVNTVFMKVSLTQGQKFMGDIVCVYIYIYTHITFFLLIQLEKKVNILE